MSSSIIYSKRPRLGTPESIDYAKNKARLMQTPEKMQSLCLNSGCYPFDFTRSTTSTSFVTKFTSGGYNSCGTSCVGGNVPNTSFRGQGVVSPF